MKSAELLIYSVLVESDWSIIPVTAYIYRYGQTLYCAPQKELTPDTGLALFTQMNDCDWLFTLALVL